MGVSIRRVATISAVALAVLAMAGLLIVHLPIVRGQLLALASRQLASRFHLDLRAAELDYNLLTRHVSLRDVRLAASGHEQEPFLTADRVAVTLPWSVFAGHFALDRVELDGARVGLVRRADGSSNLPHGSGAGRQSASPLKLDIRGIAARDLAFRYVDEGDRVRIDAGGVQMTLDPHGVPGAPQANGPIAIAGGVRLDIGEHHIAIAPLTGRLGFDGSGLTLEDVAVTTREGHVTVGGSIARVFDAPALDLRFEGTVDAARAHDWVDLPMAVGGAAAVRGTVAGPAGELTIGVEASSAALRLGALPGAAVDATVTITPDAVVVDRASLRAGAGTVDATVHAGLGEGGVTTVTAAWKNLQAATVLAVFDQARTRHLAAALTGSMTMTRGAERPLALTVKNRAIAPAAPPAGSAPLDGTLSLEVGGGHWTATQTHTLGGLRVDGTIGGRIAGNALTTASVAGPLTVDGADVAAAATAIERAGLDLPAIATSTRGPLHARVDLGGRLDAPEVQAHVSSEALVLPAIAPAAVEADLSVSADRVDVPAFSARVAGGTLEGNAAFDLRGHTLSGRFDLDAPDAGKLVTVLPEALHLAGPVSATGTLGGAPSAPEVRAELSGHDLSVAGQAVETLSASTRVTGDAVFVDALRLTANGGELTGAGSYAWERGAYSAKLDGVNLAWTGQLGGEAPTDVRVTQVAFAGTGTVAAPGGEGTVAFELSGGAAGNIVERGTAAVRLEGSQAVLDAALPSLGARVKGTVQTHAPYAYEATADVTQMNLAPLAELGGLPAGGVSGTLSLTAAAHGNASDAADSSEVSATLQQVGALVGGVPVTLQAPATITWRQDDLRTASLALGIGSGSLTAAGRLAAGNGADWAAHFDAELAELLQAAHGVVRFPVELSASGHVVGEWRSTGGVDRSTATLALDEGQVGWADVPPVTALTLRAGFDGRMVTVDSLSGTWQAGGITGSAAIPRALLERRQDAPAGAAPRGHAQLKVTGMTQQAIAPWVSQAVLDRITGTVSATLDADILGTDVKGIDGTLVLDEARLNLAYIDVQQARPTRIALRDGRITMEDVSWTAGGGPLAVTGSVALDAPGGTALDLGVKGDLNLGLFVAFAPTTWTAGSAVVDLQVAGTAANPDVHGRVELQNGEAAVFNPRLILYDLNGAVVVDNGNVRFGGVTGSLNGGSIRFDGRLGLPGRERQANGQVTVEVSQVAMEFPQGLLSELDGLITFGPREKEWVLGGDVRISRSSYRRNLSLPALAASRRTRAPIAADAEPSFLDRMRLNLFVVTEEDLNVDNNYGRIAAGAAVRVVGTAAEPGLTGRVTLREGGEVFLAGRTFRVERGAISFVSATRIEPDMDIELRTLSGGVDVALTLNGTLDQLKTDVRSTTPEHTDKEAQEALYGNLGGEDAATLLSAELLGATGRAVGLDTLRLERGATDSDDFRNDPTLIVEDTNTTPTTRLTLSKRLRPDVELIVSRSLQDSGGIAVAVSYKVRRNIELRASQRENTDRAIAIRHEVTFGGGAAARAAAPSAPQPRISAVRFSGAPGRPEAEIRKLLKLKEGDRFAFYIWQRDVDRLKADYTARGYYEARVRPSRTQSEDGQSVVLDYRIDQGPRTTVVIEGHPSHEALRRDLEDAWSRAIFDRFLVDEARRLVALDLLRDNYIGSKIDVTTTQPDPDSKQLRIVIADGTHVGRREIRFTGNQEVSSGQLAGTLAGQGLDDDVWLDPSTLDAAVVAFYRELGYLAVDVKAAAPVVEGDRGVLPVTIDEHPRFAFAEPVVQGVNEARAARVRRLVRISAGTPYDATAVEDARRRVERLYARQGFNNARVEARSTSDQAARTVTMTLSVDEGLQQILREVTTEGDDRTKDGVVVRALRLQVDQPVNLNQWAQARKRLYDTNVFAQVDIEPVSMGQSEADKAAGVDPVRAVVRLVEYPEWRLRYGLQLNDQRTTASSSDVPSVLVTREQNLGILADIQNRNLFGRAIAGGLAVRLEPDRRIGSLFASNSSFFGLPIRTQTFVYTSREHDREPLDVLIDRVGASLEQRYQARRRLEIVYAYRFDHTRTYENVPDPEIDAANRTGKITAGAIVDRRNDPFNATRGWFTTVNYELAARTLGGDSRNNKILAQEYFFRSFGDVVLASRAQIGTSWGLDLLTYDNRFLLGGATTVRGYGQDSLGPRDIIGEPGGQSLILLNQEVRFPVKGWVKGVGFIDAGNVWAERSALSLSDLKIGYGLGMRLDTPFAMLRVDFGIPGGTQPGSGRQPNRLGSGRFYIGIGHIF